VVLNEAQTGEGQEGAWWIYTDEDGPFGRCVYTIPFLRRALLVI
jgi:hypothetical protein